MILAQSHLVRADGFTPTNFPDCIKHILPSGIRICGFTDPKEWGLVLIADKELSAIRELLRLEREKTSELSAQVENYKGQIEAYVAIAQEKDRRNKELTTDLLDTDRRYQKERVKPKWGNPFAWTAAAVATAVLGGFVLSSAI